MSNTQEIVLHKIRNARDAADAKWTHSGCDGVWLDNPYEGLTVLAEEFGEVARGILEKDEESIERELIDVAQVATAWLESFQAKRAVVLEDGPFLMTTDREE